MGPAATSGDDEALRPTDGRSIGRLPRRLATPWKAPELADIAVVLNPRLSWMRACDPSADGDSGG